MTLFGNTALIVALGLLLTPVAVHVRATGITQSSGASVEIARRYPKCSRAKRAPCEMFLPEQEDSDVV